MVSIEVQKAILQKALKANPTPFSESHGTFQWTTSTRVKSKATDRSYDVVIDITIHPTHKLAPQVQACLCKSEGVRFEDLMIVAMLDPKLEGKITFSGLPRTEGQYDFMKFAKKVADKNS